ncbi:ATP-binding protein [Nitrincola sp.]|uniref:ATP-binding protein n=1 Tax=Nitrincola sp. TaxID=1926584 RepID=UPI003A8DC97D
MLTMRTRMLGLIGALIALMLGMQGLYLNFSKADLLSEQMGLRALSVAKTVAVIPELIAAFDAPDPAAIIQPIAERIRLETGAEYVVVGNRDEVRYSHPVPERLGKKMVGSDNEPALLYGESYISFATGTLGEAMRGKTPVRDTQGNIIGVVSVGFLVDQVSEDVGRSLYLGWLMIATSVVLGLVGAVWISAHIKRLILGLEPHEIARLINEKEAILQSIHEGIVAVNRDGRITLLNQSAQRTLGISGHHEFQGMPVDELVPHSRLQDVLTSGKRQFDQELWIGDTLVVVNRVPIFNPQGEVDGAVSTFRSQQEIRELYAALKQVNADADLLREQAHEFSNRLYTISGLLQLGKIDEALALIHQEGQLEQDQVRFVLQHLNNPVLGAMLLSKMNQARLRHIQFEMDNSSSLDSSLHLQAQDALLKILSNLIDNAFDAAQEKADTTPKVRLFFTDLGEQLLIEVEDNGPGVEPEALEQLIRQGYSTKSGTHGGIGLALVKRIVDRYAGNIYLEEGELGGACFVVTLEKALISITDATG